MCRLYLFYFLLIFSLVKNSYIISFSTILWKKHNFQLPSHSSRYFLISAFSISLLSQGLLRSVDRTTLGRFRSSRDRKTCLIYRNCRQSRILKAPARNCGAGFRFGETPRRSLRANELPPGRKDGFFSRGKFRGCSTIPTLYLDGVGDLSVRHHERLYGSTWIKRQSKFHSQ